MSRYPASGCGGILTGDRKGDAYHYNEVVTWGGLDEKPDDGCVGGPVVITVDGDTMKFEWSGTAQGQSHSLKGELHRQ